MSTSTFCQAKVQQENTCMVGTNEQNLEWISYVQIFLKTEQIRWPYNIVE